MGDLRAKRPIPVRPAAPRFPDKEGAPGNEDSGISATFNRVFSGSVPPEEGVSANTGARNLGVAAGRSAGRTVGAEG